jgi:hypothetical protein
MDCLHDGVHADGSCYFCCKVTGGLLAQGTPEALTADQRVFVGLLEGRCSRGGWRTVDVNGWEDLPVSTYERTVDWSGRDTLMYELRPESAQELVDWEEGSGA